MSRARVNILTTLNTLFLDLEDELPSEAFTDAMQAELNRLCSEPQPAPNSEMLLGALNRLFTEFEDEEPSAAFTYAALAEMSRLVGIFAADDSEPPEGLLRAYLFIADEYMNLRHYLFSKEYYLKTLEILPKCRKDIFEDEEIKGLIEEGCLNLLSIYGNRGEYEAANRIYTLIRDFLPERYEAIHKRAMKKPLLNYDPVEYTDEYLAILPELDAKIEAEIKDPFRGRGFCFRYWHIKQEILKRDYSMDWDSPSVLNPGVRFD